MGRQPPNGRSLSFMKALAVGLTETFFIEALDDFGVYRLYGRADELIYVGMAKDPRTRIRVHTRSAPWGTEIRSAVVTWYSSEDEARQAESDAIYDEDPVYNVVGSKTWQIYLRWRQICPLGSLASFVSGRNTPVLNPLPATSSIASPTYLDDPPSAG